MFWDVLIAVGIGLTQLAVTAYAVDISVKENRVKNAKSQEAATAKQEDLQHKVEAVQNKLNENQNALLTYTVSLKHDHQELTPYLPFQFDTRYIVTSSEAKNLRCDFDIFTVDGSPSEGQNRDASRRFRQAAVSRLDRRGLDAGIGMYCWTTLSLPLNEKSISRILAGTSTVYILAEAKWMNPSGSDGSTDLCSYIQRPTTRLLTEFNTVIHQCVF